MLKYKNSAPKNRVVEDALKALHEIQEEAKRNGTSEMTLEEINLEIYLARREAEAREDVGYFGGR